jgi:hypothetical protein
VKDHSYDICPCQPVHGGSGRYVFRSPDRAHCRRSNYGRCVFRPACDGRIDASGDNPGRLVMADTTTWPGIPRAFYPPAQPGTGYSPPQGRYIQGHQPRSPVPLLDELRNAKTPSATVHTLTARGDTASQIPPRKGAGPIRDVG